MYLVLFFIFIWILIGVVSLYFTAVYINKFTKDLKKLDNKKWESEIKELDTSLLELISKESLLGAVLMGPFMFKNFYTVKKHILKIYEEKVDS